MSRLADELDLQLESTAEGQSVKATRELLEQYGIKGKQFDALPVVITSSVVLEPDTVVQPIEFFIGDNKLNANRNVSFPAKTMAFNIQYITADVDVNFGENKQETLELMRHFLKDSVIKTKLMRGDHLSIPLIDAVNCVIEHDGEKYTERVVRVGFKINYGIKIPLNGEFEAQLIPAPNFKTHPTAVNPIAGKPNEIRLSMHGYSLQTSVGV